ncbi:MAG: hypothetical protein QOC71_1586 [Thermoplasmata archaeon]|jgi:hypothetical protein|nr:hypothetical protein [Thermoplasmata archaeon]
MAYEAAPDANLALARPLVVRPRRLQNAAGLLLIGGCIAAFLSMQLLVGFPMFNTLQPDGSATDSTYDDGTPAAGGHVTSREVVFVGAAIGVLLAIGGVLAIRGFVQARRGNAQRAFGLGLAASLLPPLNPLALAGALLARSALRPAASGWTPVAGSELTEHRTQPAMGTAQAFTTQQFSALLRTGGWMLLAGAILSAVGAVASLVAVTMQLAGFAAMAPAGTRLPVLAFAIVGGVGLAFAAGTVLGVVGWRQARLGRAQPAAGWGLASGLLPPFNPLLVLGALLCYGSPESQQASAPPDPRAQPP